MLCIAYELACCASLSPAEAGEIGQVFAAWNKRKHSKGSANSEDPGEHIEDPTTRDVPYFLEGAWPAASAFKSEALHKLKREDMNKVYDALRNHRIKFLVR